MSLFALVAAGGCLAVPPAPDDETEGPASICDGDPGLPEGDSFPWSIASLPGWSQQEASARDLEDWLGELGVFNHVLHGSIAAAPDGHVTYVGGDLTGSTQSCAGIVAAHRLGYPILVVLGGDGGDDFLREATAEENRATLVASLTDFIDRHGYDGVSLAWISGVEEAQLTALVEDLSNMFAARARRTLLTVDVSSTSVPPSVSAGWVGLVDAINVMSYGTDWENEVERYLDAGVPPDLIDLGVGLAVRDTSRASVAAKIEAALAGGLHGVESWELGALASGDDPRLVAYEPLFQ
jgi:hypothetical protein